MTTDEQHKAETLNRATQTVKDALSFVVRPLPCLPDPETTAAQIVQASLTESRKKMASQRKTSVSGDGLIVGYQ